MDETKDTARRQAEWLIAGLGNTVGIEGIAFDDNLQCYLSFDDQPVMIGFDEESGYITLESPVIDVPSSPSNAFYSWVLNDNYTSFSNGIGCLALDSESDKIVWLDRQAVTSIGQIEFENWLSKSVDRVEYWVRQLSERVNSPDSTGVREDENATYSSDFVFRP